MTYDKNNIFAKILRGEIPCKKVYENEYVLSFYDINPQKKIHILLKLAIYPLILNKPSKKTMKISEL